MERELWTCPRCGHRFVTANIWHSCTNIELGEPFRKAAPNVRRSFDRFVELIAGCGEIEVIAQKSRIVVMAQVRFAGAQVRRDRLIANFALTRRIQDPRFRHEAYGPRWIAHRFELRDPADLDDHRFAEWLCESYRDLGLRQSRRRRNE